MNPYLRNAPPLSRGLQDWQSLLCPPLPKTSHPLQRARLILAAAALEDCPPCGGDAELSRQRALIRRVEWQQRLRFLSLLPRARPCERLLLALFMDAELTAAAAQLEPDPRARAVMDFLLPECCDMLYRAANLLSLAYGVSADDVLRGQAELMPGRPCIAAHRHPFDDAQPPLAGLTEHARTYVSLYLLRASARSASRLAASLLDVQSARARALYEELSLILLEHATQYAGLLGQETPPCRALLLRAYALCSLFHDLTRQEDASAPLALYREAESFGCAQLQLLRTLLPRATEEPAPFLQDDLPAPLILRANKGYIRDALRGVGVTLRRGERLPVGALPESADFFRYQRHLNADLPRVPSHAVVAAHIRKRGCDFRAELAPHPVEMLRDRAVDQVRVGR